MTAPDHQKRVGVVHIAAAGHQRDRLLAGVDQIPVDFVVARRRPDAEDAVLAVQDDLAIGGNEIGNHRREPDPEVHIGAIGEILRGPPGDLATFQRHQLPPISSPDFPVLGEAQTYAGPRHPARFHRCNELNRTRFSLLTWACNPG